MHAKKFIAENFRTALKEVREAIGPDAVILSSQVKGNKVEVIATPDNQEITNNHHEKPTSVRVGLTHRFPKSAEILTNTHTKSKDTNVLKKDNIESLNKNQSLDSSTGTYKNFEQQPKKTKYNNCIVEDEALIKLQRELASVRQVLTDQYQGIAWQNFSNLNPLIVSVLKKLDTFGIIMPVSLTIIDKLSNEVDFEKCALQAIQEIINLIKIPEQEMLLESQSIALIGPSGAGKTSLLAKLCAKYIQQFGNSNVSIITLDDSKIGSNDEISAFGQIFNIDTYKVNDCIGFDQAINKCSNSDLVLVDTPGLHYKDDKLSEIIDFFGTSSKNIKKLGVIPSNLDIVTLEDMIKKLVSLGVNDVAVTKVDENCRLGGIISLIIQYEIQAQYLTNGRHIPNDLLVASRTEYLNHLVKDEEQLSGYYAEDELSWRYARNG